MNLLKKMELVGVPRSVLLDTKEYGFHGVFLMYPAHQTFADHFVPREEQDRIRWIPHPVGLIAHPNGKRTLMTAISAPIDQEGFVFGKGELNLLQKRIKKVARAVGATSLHFAGTLPGRMAMNRINRGGNQNNEQIATVENVLKAALHMRRELGSPEMPVFILGVNGYIGRELFSQLQKQGVSVSGVDKDGGSLRGEKPKTEHLLVNVAKPEALGEYVRAFPYERFHVLNEVYPGPEPEELAYVQRFGHRVFHLAGVVAECWPPFPGEYQGCVPCCAALPGIDYEVVVRELC